MMQSDTPNMVPETQSSTQHQLVLISRSGNPRAGRDCWGQLVVEENGFHNLSDPGSNPCSVCH